MISCKWKISTLVYAVIPSTQSRVISQTIHVAPPINKLILKQNAARSADKFSFAEHILWLS